MTTATQKILLGAGVLLAAAAFPACADPQPQGFLAGIATDSANQAATFGQPTAARLDAAGERIARHLETRPQDLQHVDALGEAVVTGTAQSLVQEARQIQGAVTGNAVRSVFGLFKRQD